MTVNLKELSRKPDRITGGHRCCAGCGAPIAAKWVLKALREEDKAIIVNATGCLEVSTTIFPYSAWKDSFIHSAFENAAATASGVEAAYRALKRRNGINGNYKIIAFGGDGGTYDIGLQSLSGAFERGHDFTYVCYNNGAYMNTGIQRSSATPQGADTTTSPAGSAMRGKLQPPKNLSKIVAAHDIPYMAQTSPSRWSDLYRKAEKSIYTEGPSFLNLLSVCPRGWRCESDLGLAITELAIESCVWPLYEIDHGVFKLNYRPREKLPVTEWLKAQGRFRHLFDQGAESMLADIQARVDADWYELLSLCKEG